VELPLDTVKMEALVVVRQMAQVRQDWVEQLPLVKEIMAVMLMKQALI
jgi:hypothetical protein